ncbi:MAG: calcium/sodium antiporter [Gammaproteobacteria bacterium]|nr:calcium/sodium antiporter [Gammaproteobacteria bacterium]MDP6734080.1 calcium/sodium antiporter [Gammaproteobacteria bacterium]
MLVPTFFVLCGFIMLGVGAEMMLSGSSRLAVRWGISPLLVGLTIVAFGTSAPELAVSIESTTSNLSALALGNVIGSNIANIGLVLGIMALIKPIRIERQLVRKQIPLVIISSMLMGVLLLDGQLDRSDGLFLTVGLVGYLIISYLQIGAEYDARELELHPTQNKRQSGQVLFYLLLIIAGLSLLIFGSRIFVINVVTLAGLLGISEAVIGLTLVAVGTSIPELATSLVAVSKNQADMAIGNVVGSNIFNVLCVLGITAIIGTVYGDQFAVADFTVMILFSLILLPFAWTNFTLSRMEGLFLLSGYVVYLVFVSQQT